MLSCMLLDRRMPATPAARRRLRHRILAHVGTVMRRSRPARVCATSCLLLPMRKVCTANPHVAACAAAVARSSPTFPPPHRRSFLRAAAQPLPHVRASAHLLCPSWDSVPVSLAFRSNVKYHVLLRDLSVTAIIISSNKLESRGAIQKLKLLQLKQCSVSACPTAVRLLSKQSAEF
jgi:hypothetical protein